MSESASLQALQRRVEALEHELGIQQDITNDSTRLLLEIDNAFPPSFILISQTANQPISQ